MAAGGLTIYADEDSPAVKAGDVVPKPVSSSTDMSFAQSCLSYCLREHPFCHFRGGSGKISTGKRHTPTALEPASTNMQNCC
ncbi:hypothetical protein GJ744_002896 [Endocarpon pusillum]|uniref:Uncharacterized protein n=1 Tax=Endocarpon pusillum TaxID=364733 RepID=A0A8H7AA95_9EURO|nr:hypothetical protein GJ744_002896 [Endocarpon pusillum]